MRNFKSYQLTIVVTGVILLALMLSVYRPETTPLERKPGFSAWVSLEGKLRIRYYNASAKSVLLNAYPPGYDLSTRIITSWKRLRLWRQPHAIGCAFLPTALMIFIARQASTSR